MLRIVACICTVLLFSSCEKAWRRLHIEKRVYRGGYYVHVPWERRTPINEYPKPQPYPVDHSRTAKTDSTQKNAGGVPASGSSQTTQTQTPGSSGGTGSQSYGGGGSGNQPNPPANGPGYGYQPPNGTNGATGSPQRSTATYQPAPPLQPIPQEPEPPLQRPQSVNPPITKNDSVVPTPTEPSDDKQRNFQFPEGEFSLIAELGVYNAVAPAGIEITPLSVNAGLAARYTIHPWSRHEISGEAGFFQSTLSVAQDQHKVAPMFVEVCKKERISQWKFRMMLTDRICITRNEEAAVDAIEVGGFTDIGMFSTHVGINSHWNDDKAAFTSNKSRLFGLRYLRNLQYGMTARIVSGKWCAFANYRFSTMVKADPDGGDLPKLVLGATFVLTE